MVVQNQAVKDLQRFSPEVGEFSTQCMVAQVDVTTRNRHVCVYVLGNVSLEETSDEGLNLPL
jgi:hypothetical protein